MWGEARTAVRVGAEHAERRIRRREGQSEWRMDVPDSRAGLAPPGCHDCESGGLWWLDPGHDPMVTMTRRPDFAYIYTTRRYAVHAAAGVTLIAGHVSDLGRGGACIQPTTPFSLLPDPFLE